jgi:hypothetical protein
MASQSEALQHLMGFFLVKEHDGLPARPQPQPAKNGTAHAAAAPQPPPPARPAAALPAKRANGAAAEGGGFTRF